MARVRRRETATAGAVEWPPELATLVDWTAWSEPSDAPGEPPDGTYADDPEAFRVMELKTRAVGRWRDARAAWAAAHGGGG